LLFEGVTQNDEAGDGHLLKYLRSILTATPGGVKTRLFPQKNGEKKRTTGAQRHR
jgi:hypothetical protein